MNNAAQHESAIRFLQSRVANFSNSVKDIERRKRALDKELAALTILVQNAPQRIAEHELSIRELSNTETTSSDIMDALAIKWGIK